MPSRRRVDPAAGLAAVQAWSAVSGDHGESAGQVIDRDVVALAVRFSLEELGARAPGRSVEVRVPPHGVVQCVEGMTHRRGTPPNVVETDADTWLSVATGRMTWEQAWESGRLMVS
ncbi:MAG TPA: sterol carrier family protein, partial [Phycicoccus sp.]|nr:sterol carrier family protein [Phycicoccus sp.]